MADDFEKGDSPLYARLARAHADDPLVAAIARDHQPRWEVPLRLFAGVHYLALSGRVGDPWASFQDVLADHRDWLAGWVAEQPVQTNEVQRSWGLLPAFLAVSEARPLDLVELGSSAGLNLVWDRYRYRYGDSSWGPDGAPLELEGEARGGPPPELLRRSAPVRERIGLDRSPVDVTRREDTLVLEAFVWADQEERLKRLRRALEIARRDPPPLLEGDYLEVLPEILGRSDRDVLTVVYHSASTGYLRREDRKRLANAIEEAGRRVPLAWISYEFVEEEEEGYDRFALDLRLWPGGGRRRLARLDGHGNRMRWLA